MSNPFDSIYRRQNTGDPAEKYRNLPDFPYCIDLEATSACNFRCLMCPTGNLSLQRPAKIMAEKTFETILKQCRPTKAKLRFIGWGEPLMHPRLPAWIYMAHSAGIDTHINTNGSRLDETKALRLIQLGLGSIKFSFQGIDRRSYADMRNIDFFEPLLKTIKMFRALRDGESDDGLPWIAASTSITHERPEAVEAFVERMRDLVDELSVGHTIFEFFDADKVRLSKKDQERLRKHSRDELNRFEDDGGPTGPPSRPPQPAKRHPDPCPEVYDKLSIHADGSVVVCCNDYDGVVELGNVNQTPIADLWRHDKIEAYRKRLAKKNYQAPLCETCFDYMKLTG